jgi:hypothetical protein
MDLDGALVSRNSANEKQMLFALNKQIILFQFQSAEVAEIYFNLFS